MELLSKGSWILTLKILYKSLLNFVFRLRLFRHRNVPASYLEMIMIYFLYFLTLRPTFFHFNAYTQRARAPHLRKMKKSKQSGPLNQFMPNNILLSNGTIKNWRGKNTQRKKIKLFATTDFSIFPMYSVSPFSFVYSQPRNHSLFQSVKRGIDEGKKNAKKLEWVKHILKTEFLCGNKNISDFELKFV